MEYQIIKFIFLNNFKISWNRHDHLVVGVGGTFPIGDVLLGRGILAQFGHSDDGYLQTCPQVSDVKNEAVIPVAPQKLCDFKSSKNMLYH